MAKVKKVKTNKKNTKMRRTVLGALSAVFMISALIVAAIPSSQSSASMEPEGAQQEDLYVDHIVAALGKKIPYDRAQLPGDSSLKPSLAQSKLEFETVNAKPTASSPNSGSPLFVDKGGTVLKKDNSGNGIVVGVNEDIISTISEINIPSKTMPFLKEGGQAVRKDGTTKLYYYTEQTVTDDFGATTTTYDVKPWLYTDDFYVIDQASSNVSSVDDTIKICVEGSNTDPISYGGAHYKQIPFADLTQDVYTVTEIADMTNAQNTGKGVFEDLSVSQITIGDTIKYIGDSAFYNTNSLSTINIPASVTTIGDFAFAKSGISQLTGADQVTWIGTGAFSQSRLNAISFSGAPKAVGPFCFAGCENLRAVNMCGDSQSVGYVKYLGDGTFYECKALEHLVMCNDSMNELDKLDYMAYGCENLLDITLPNHNYTPNKTFHYTNVTGCKSLKFAVVPNSSILLDCGTGIHDAVIPGVSDEQKYGDHDDCTAASNSSVGADVFGPINLGYNYDPPRLYGKDRFSSFYIKGKKEPNPTGNAYDYAKKHSIAFCYEADGKTKFERFYNDYTYIIAKDAGDTNTSCALEQIQPGNPQGSNMIIPSQIGPNTVASISQDTMASLNEGQKAKATYVQIPKTLTGIGANTFNGFTKLRTVKFEDAMACDGIEANAFYTAMKQIDQDGDDDLLRFIGDVSKDGVLTPPYEYCMNQGNFYNDPDGWQKQYITYCTKFPTNQQIRLTYQVDPVTHAMMDVQPTLVGLPTFAQASSDQYSLDPLNKDNENTIAKEAIRKYGTGLSLEQFTTLLTDTEQAVINACTRPEIPYGVSAYTYDDSDKDNIKSVFNAGGSGNPNLVAVTMNSIKSIGEGTFDKCSELLRVEMRSSGDPEGEKLGDNAFKGCTSLETVILPNSLSEMGIAPFRDCEALTGNGVDFGSGGKFSIANDIIYEAIDGGKKIVECLPNRGNDGTSNLIGSQDAKDVTKIAPNAFMNCKYIQEADLTEANVKKIEKSTFENAEKLTQCMLGPNTTNIGEDAFKGTSLYEITILAKYAVAIDSNAFDTTKPLNLRGYRNSGVDTFSEDYSNFTFEEIRNMCTLSFVDTLAESDDKKELGTKIVEAGSTLGEQVNYNPPVHDGYTFIGWDPEDYYSIPIESDMVIKTVYSDNAEANYTIEYYINENADTSCFKETVARDGFAAGPPAAVMRAVESAKPGYEFVGWNPSNFADIPITKDLKVVAQYVYTGVFPSAQPSVSGNTPGPSAYPSSNPGGGSGSGGTTVPTVPTDSPDTDSNDSAGSSSDNDGNSGNNEGSNGSNSGNNNSGTSGGNNNSTGNNNNNNNSGNNNSGTGNSQQSGSNVSGNRPGSSSSQTSSTTNGSSSIHVTKSGISNTGVAGVNVNGSQDNYVVKVSDSEEARTLAQQALLSEYGNLDSIKYFAMDISLYDSTGTTKLENETGVSVDVTIPIPDALREYGGNNMIGSVKGGQLEKLNNRFTTIDGVPCMTFTATHFSPYAIYVDTNNLTASGIIDTTPKTADPLEPKWFLAIGLALLSILMFLLRGPKNQIILSE